MALLGTAGLRIPALSRIWVSRIPGH
ncbi:hypothetical protein F0726_01276 [Acidithiobacillus caldus]|nr:hypothetical protein F0726_01276 [Acidithiobacillus caldus]